jgi:glycosyltransferase involved in cell wall biosynthesis
MFDFATARIVLVGPLPPPSGGMANQTRQLKRLLEDEGASVTLVRTNAPYRPAWVGRLRGLRALFRIVPYLAELRRAARGATLFHVMGNSGWAFHLFAAPALLVARRARVPAILNYRGGNAEEFFRRSTGIAKRWLRTADAVVVPSRFLQDVFAKLGVEVEVVPNVVDLEVFRPAPPRATNGVGPRLLIARHLEPIYDVETGLRAFGLVRKSLTGAVLDIAGSGPEGERLRRLALDLGLERDVHFVGPVVNERMPELYRSADLVVNPSLVDNMPISILEALASGIPVVSTNVGGVPALVENGRDAVLVPPRDPAAMAEALVSLWKEPGRREALREAGLRKARAFGWSSVRGDWARVYERTVTR